MTIGKWDIGTVAGKQNKIGHSSRSSSIQWSKATEEEKKRKEKRKEKKKGIATHELVSARLKSEFR